MAEWLVQIGGRTETLNEETLRGKLRKGELNGGELARQDGHAAWTPLYGLPVFSAVVPHRGDPRHAARLRLWRSWLVHGAVYASVVLFLSLDGRPPGFASLWGIGLAIHLAVTALADTRSFGRWATRASFSAVEPAALSTTPVSPLDEALRKLGTLRERLPEGLTSEGLSDLGGRAHALAARRHALELRADPTLLAALREQEAQVVGRVASASDARSVEAFSSELDALRGRIEVMDDARHEAERLASRERALLHQAEGIQLAVLRAESDDDAPDLSAAVDALRLGLKAEAEIERALAKAREPARG